MKIGFGNDHAAVELKMALMQHLSDRGYECIDYGCGVGEKEDYPNAAQRVAEALIKGEIDRGVLTCGTGIGISLAANKVPGIRAAVCSEPYSARLTVQHNNANILAMGARVVAIEYAKMIADEFFAAEFEGGRHQKRIDLISEIEKKYSK